MDEQGSSQVYQTNQINSKSIWTNRKIILIIIYIGRANHLYYVEKSMGQYCNCNSSGKLGSRWVTAYN